MNNNGIFAPGTGPIFLADMGCIGNETNLDDCPHNGVNDLKYHCSHSNDAGVVCPQGVVTYCIRFQLILGCVCVHVDLANGQNEIIQFENQFYANFNDAIKPFSLGATTVWCC